MARKCSRSHEWYGAICDLFHEVLDDEPEVPIPNSRSDEVIRQISIAGNVILLLIDVDVSLSQELDFSARVLLELERELSSSHA